MGACTSQTQQFAVGTGADVEPLALCAAPAEATPQAADTVTPAQKASADDDIAANPLAFNVILASGATQVLTVEASSSAVELMKAFAAVHDVPPHCNVKMFQGGQVILEDTATSRLDVEQPVFAVIVRETKIEILLQAAGSYEGYKDLMCSAQTDARDPSVRLVGPMPSILHVLEELGGQPSELKTLHAGSQGASILQFAGNAGELILPSLDATPLLAAVGVAKFNRVTLSVEVNSDAFNRGLGVVVEASPLMESTVDESGLPSYLYNGYGVSSKKKQSAIKFHPGMGGGELRVEGLGGWGNQSVGFTPKSWTASRHKLHTLALTIGADGQNVVQLRGTEAGQVWQKPWRRPLTDGVHIPALYAWLDLGGPGEHPLHIGQISFRVHLGTE